MVTDFNNYEDELERAVCLKSEVEFKKAIREWDERPVSQEQLAKIEENIKSNYRPLSAFEKSIDIRIRYYLLPLVEKLIQIEAELRSSHDVIFTEKRIDFLRHYLHSLARENWKSIAHRAYEDAANHVIFNSGYLPEYKDIELRESHDNTIRLEPNGLYTEIDELLQNASADQRILKFANFKNKKKM